jgi:hypothetical protein
MGWRGTARAELPKIFHSMESIVVGQLQVLVMRKA